MLGTGYTYNIENGNCKTPKDFLRLCLKAFGCCVDLRDESLTDFNVNEYLEKLKSEPVSDYLIESLKRAEEELEKLLKRTDNNWKVELNNKIAEAKTKLEESKINYQEESKIISYFTDNIKNWDCSEDYQNIKNFALEQLSLTEPDSYEWNERLLKELQDTDIKTYRNSNVQSAIKEVDYYKERIEQEKKSKQEKIDFIEGFLKEIEKVE